MASLLRKVKLPISPPSPQLPICHPQCFQEPLPRFGHSAVVYHDGVFIWGGMGCSRHLGDHHAPHQLEKFNYMEGFWETLTTRNDPHPGVAGHACTTTSRYAYYFGGWCCVNECNCKYSSVYKLDLEERSWENLQSVNPDLGPMAKRDCGIIVFGNGANEYLCVIGGFGQLPKVKNPKFQYILRDLADCDRSYGCTNGWTNEVHIMNTTSEVKTWESLEVVGDKLPPFQAFSLTKIDETHAVIFGGYTPSKGCLDDTYMLEYKEKKMYCKRLSCTGNKPPRRHSHAAICLTGPLHGYSQCSLLIMGGEDQTSKVLDDCWLLSLNDTIWKRISIPSQVVQRSLFSLSAFHISPDCVWLLLFGGTPSWNMDQLDTQQQRISQTVILEFNVESKGDWLADSILLSSRSLYKEHIQSRLEDGLIKWQKACSKAILLMHKQQVTQDEKLAKCQYLLDEACKEHVLYSEKAQVKLRKLDQLENEVSSLRSQVAYLQSVQQKTENELMVHKEKIKISEEESEVLKHDLEERLKLKQDELEAMMATHSDQKRELQSKLADCKMQLSISQEELKKTKLQAEDAEKAINKYKNMPKDMNELDDLTLGIFKKEVERCNQLEIQLMFTTQHYEQKIDEKETEIQKWQEMDASNRQLITDLKFQLKKLHSDEHSALKISLDSRPDTMLFTKAVSSKIKTKWFAFGRCLEIPHGELKSWEMANRGMQDVCFFEVLHYWENNEPQPFTWRTVLKVLESLNEHVVASNLKLELGNLN